MNHLRISIGIFIVLAASRFIPHPPNFTSLLSLAFYIPLVFGLRYLPVLLLSFIFTDLVIGMHNLTFFTYGTIVLIGLGSNFFKINIFSRITGSLLGACLFFIITNFGVWSTGIYGYTISGLILCYTLAIPFFAYTLISTFIFSGIFEGFYSLCKNKIKLIRNSIFHKSIS